MKEWQKEDLKSTDKIIMLEGIMTKSLKEKIIAFNYTHAPCCLNCHWNDICSCGEFGDKGICLLYKEKDDE